MLSTPSAERRFALVDCNNFYVSCERLFRPDLRTTPMAVLSNNDGCIVARSPEVKALGIKMGTPLHQVSHLLDHHQVQLFSSNYPLYADLSARVMRVLAEFTANLEIYSIDEAFLDLTGMSGQASVPLEYGTVIKQRVERWVGIPVCVGIGPSKTLAKLANHAAKRWPRSNGVADLSTLDMQRRVMTRIALKEVWGVGRQLSRRLNQQGLYTAWDLRQADPARIRRQYSVVLARTVEELRGVSCLALEAMAAAKKQIICSRSFKQKITAFRPLREATSRFCSRAAEKLRAQHSVASMITLFICTSPFDQRVAQYQRSATLPLSPSTDDTRRLVSVAHQLLREIYRDGFRYQKCAVILSGISPATSAGGQLDLFENDGERLRSDALMNVMDAVNRRYAHSLVIAASGLQPWMRGQGSRLSQGYTTRWDGLAVVRC